MKMAYENNELINNHDWDQGLIVLKVNKACNLCILLILCVCLVVACIAVLSWQCVEFPLEYSLHSK